MAEAVHKICQRCGADCSERRRYRDAQGGYTCGWCYDDLKAELAAKEKAKALAAAGLGAEGAGEGSIPLDVDPATFEARGTRSCPGCGVSMPVDAIVCARCGFNVTTGRSPRHGDTNKPRPCFKCGYDLRGLPKDCVCPECGVDNTGAAAVVRTVSRETVREAYAEPLRYAVGGAAILLVARMVRLRPELLVWDAAALAIMVPLLVLAYGLYCYLWEDGFDAPWGLVTLRVGAVLVFDAGVTAAVGLMGAPVLSWIVPAVVYWALLMKLLEIDDWRGLLVLLAMFFAVRLSVVLAAAWAARQIGFAL